MWDSGERRAAALARAGRFGEALAELSSGTARAETLSAQVLRAELLEHTGAYDQAVDLAQRAMRARQIDGALASRCELVLGHIAMTAGRTGEAVECYRHAISLATNAGDLERLCWAQIRLIYAERTRVDLAATRTLLGEVRANACRLGDPHVTAALHIFVAAVEGERGALDPAARHLTMAQSILANAPNAWLEGELEAGWTVFDCISGHLVSAMRHARGVLRVSEVTSDTLGRVQALGNLGHILLTQARFDEAERYIRQAIDVCTTGGCLEMALVDGLARVALGRGQLAEAERFIARIKEVVSRPGLALTYQHRSFQSTAVRLALEQGDWQRAREIACAGIEVARSASDHRLEILMTAYCAEALLHDNPHEAAECLADTVASCNDSLELSAEIARIAGKLFAAMGRTEPASRHFERSIRAFTAIGHCAAAADAQAVLDGIAGQSDEDGRCPSHDDRMRSVIEDFAAGIVMMNTASSNAEGIGREAVALLRVGRCASGAVLACTDVAGRTQVVDGWGIDSDKLSTQSWHGARAFRQCLGKGPDGEFELFATGTDDLQSISTFQSVRKLVTVSVELQEGRRQRRERTALWPAEPRREDADGVLPGVFAGHRGREILALAGRVAETPVSVLITGETGTGKELVARLIHRLSARANAPFVPFNCSAVPHDMLDGQLFGHRRGAFTGAVESFPGVIRTSAGGTLLLDEIGEISLHLQPKLLRFLESGEVHPIGEPRAVHVDVRVMAATNADLQRLVADKRFREDLFYRLNVVHICLPPLRERRDEIPLLAGHFLARHARELGKSDVRLSSEAVETLSLRRWPGNIRELSNAIRRAVALSTDGDLLTPAHFSQPRRFERPAGEGLRTPADAAEITVRLDQTLAAAVGQIERAMVRWAVGRAGGHLERAARSLGLSRKGLYLKRQRLGVEN